ncbi:MAG: AAA family ATPase [Lachnospiraceae bacterium]|nr:AAA family ATPase [Lachnospiraceae bacterium]
MKIESLKIKNYKFIRELEIKQMENACIFIGKNSVGKTAILDAILTACGQKEILPKHFNELSNNIEITIKMSLSEDALATLHRQGVISRYKKYDLFYDDFIKKFPSYRDGILTFTFIANKEGKIRYSDGIQKDNEYIPLILPKIYYIDHRRDIDEIENDILRTGIREKTIGSLTENKCMFDESKQCNTCFQCIGKIEKKPVTELTVFETEKLLEYKMLHLDSDDFMERMNQCFRRNSGQRDQLVTQMNVDLAALMDVEVVRYRENSEMPESIHDMSEGMKSIYILSLLEAYMQEEEKLPCILMMEDPELFLHPELQKTASETLYKLSEKNQVIFSTHSPTMIFNFSKKHIKQVQLNKEGLPVIREQNDIGKILDDLGFSANDFMNVSFVFIVEGKQDKNRLPLLLNKYYSEVYDKDGNLQRIAIVATNSCTNIRTYANLKYMNQLYLKDHFLMIRDGDGKDARELKEQLCTYYANREKQDAGALPRVREKNVLILKYYSFENYFLNPKVMAKIGVIESEEAFYDILYDKYEQYLHRIKSFVKMREKTGLVIRSKEDIKKNLETILIYGRGHNLFDIFYGRYRGEKENEILKKYIEVADRDTFKDILDTIDSFMFFDSRKIDTEE